MLLTPYYQYAYSLPHDDVLIKFSNCQFQRKISEMMKDRNNFQFIKSLSLASETPF